MLALLPLEAQTFLQNRQTVLIGDKLTLRTHKTIITQTNHNPQNRQTLKTYLQSRQTYPETELAWISRLIRHYKVTMYKHKVTMYATNITRYGLMHWIQENVLKYSNSLKFSGSVSQHLSSSSHSGKYISTNCRHSSVTTCTVKNPEKIWWADNVTSLFVST